MSANQNDPQYKLRWSSELREKIAESAKAHNRSMNADIVARLQDSLRTLPSLYIEAALHHVSTEELLSELMRRAEDAEMTVRFERLKFDVN